MLGSKPSTSGRFGVLMFAILNPLEQFSASPTITIVDPFLASVVVFPSLLVLRTRWVGITTEIPAMEPYRDDQPTATDGGE